MAGGYEGLARYYRLLFPLGPKQERFFARLTGEGGVRSMLDVGCGTGEQLAWFSARGIRAVGLEPDAAMFAELSRRSWHGLSPSVQRVGLESLPGAHGGRHDLVLCLGNTLPHLPDAAAARTALAGMRAALAPGGRLALQTVNFDRILAAGRADFPVIERELPGEGKVSLRREYDLAALPGRIVFHTRLETPSGGEEASWPLLPVRLDELAEWMEEAGLVDPAFYGDYDLGPFTADSPALVAVARH
jgi:glycine/sarcosine N-methyltransferase